MKREEQRKRNGQCGDDRGANADQEKNQNDQNKNHSAKKISFDSVGGNADQVAAIVVGTDAHVAREHSLVDFFGLALDAFQNVLCLLAAAHQDDAFDGVVVIFLLILKTEDAEAWGVADFHAADVLDSNWRAVVAGHHDFADIFRGLYQAQPAHVVKLTAL